MANPRLLEKLKAGVATWNEWRERNPRVELDLREARLPHTNFARANIAKANFTGANLQRADLGAANLSGADLLNVNLFGATLNQTDFRGANLRGANLLNANLFGANLSGADLAGAQLSGADLRRANFRGSNLKGADLSLATLVGTNFELANLTGCSVYGVSAWDIRLEGAIQSNLVVTPHDQSVIQVDNLEVAQFVYLLLNNERIRNVIDTITSKVVLILGRFTPERKPVLEAIREELRRRNYLPILFDFQKPDGKDLTGTVTTLANMARFIIADLTDPSSVPDELAMIAPGTSVPLQTIVLEGQREYAMFRDLMKYPWVLEPYKYESPQLLLAQLKEKVIAPAEAKAEQLTRK